MSHALTINGYHTEDDWNLILQNDPKPEMPGVNSYLVYVPGSNGFTNLTQALTNETTYKSREGTWKFTSLDDSDDVPDRLTAIGKKVHGQSVKVVLDDDSSHYYEGFTTVEKNGLVCHNTALNVNYTLQPFKYDQEETVVSVEYDSSSTQNVEDYGVMYAHNEGATTYFSVSGGRSYADLTDAGLSIQFWFPVEDIPATSLSVILTFTDSSGNTYSETITRDYISSNLTSDGLYGYKSYNTSELSSLSSSIDFTKIVQITAKHYRDVKMRYTVTGTMIWATGCDASVQPTFYLPSSHLVLNYEGAKYEFSSMQEKLDGVMVRRTGSNFAFGVEDGTAVSGTIKIKYRKAWL